jgi:hypothetical protein
VNYFSILTGGGKYRKDILTFIKWFVAVNVVLFIALWAITISIDFEQTQGEVSTLDFILGESAILITFLLFELFFIFFLFTRIFISKRNDEQELKEMIVAGESGRVEFKGSLRWDYETNSIGRYIEHAAVKTIAGFLNSNGGSLIIGVDDEKNKIGLDKDYGTLKKKNRDGFLLHLSNLVNRYLGKEFNHYIKVRIVSIDDLDVCIVDVSPSGSPVYLKDNDQEEFFVRSSNSTEPLSISEAHKYIASHWKTKR